MLRHVVLFRWNEGTTADQVEAITTGLRALPATIPQIANYQCGPNLGLVEGTFDYGIVADFADQADWAVYRADAGHQALIAERINPHVAERVAVQYEV